MASPADGVGQSRDEHHEEAEQREVEIAVVDHVTGRQVEGGEGRRQEEEEEGEAGAADGGSPREDAQYPERRQDADWAGSPPLLARATLGNVDASPLLRRRGRPGL